MRLKNERKGLLKFCGVDDKLRPVLQKPFINKNFNDEMWASDGHLLLMIRKGICRGKYREESEKFNKRISVKPVNCNRIVDFKNIDEACSRFELVPEMKKISDEKPCPECHGKGIVTWHYNGYDLEDDCPVCEGYGTIDDDCWEKTGRMIPPPESFLRIDGTVFFTHTITKAVEGLRLMGFEKMVHTVSVDTYANMFKVADGVDLLIMPVCMSSMHGDEHIEEVLTEIIRL
jgi:hypothetical protein